ncbi:hypothetical protein ALQ65_200049 [Pseudomonas syringae pv. coriandricola]|uniref:Uncharacterized protein n=2 Tax=Pseudomonas syringae group TaxID=136849 RepID=A0A3M3J8K2_9PSED|nr:hypothetical protein ALQ65_200049 [Pseudomonas syringae pv. coriandricola]
MKHMERDESQKLLVIGGPFDGQRMARAGDEFTEVVGPKNSRFYGRHTYNLRWHPMLKKLVWALPENKSLKRPTTDA